MDTVAYDRWNQNEGDDAGFFAHEMLRHDVYAVPDNDDALVFCPECGQMAECFDMIPHKGWCFYNDRDPIRPGNF